MVIASNESGYEPLKICKAQNALGLAVNRHGRYIEKDYTAGWNMEYINYVTTN